MIYNYDPGSDPSRGARVVLPGLCQSTPRLLALGSSPVPSVQRALRFEPDTKSCVTSSCVVSCAQQSGWAPCPPLSPRGVLEQTALPQLQPSHSAEASVLSAGPDLSLSPC